MSDIGSRSFTKAFDRTSVIAAERAGAKITSYYDRAIDANNNGTLSEREVRQAVRDAGNTGTVASDVYVAVDMVYELASAAKGRASGHPRRRPELTRAELGAWVDSAVEYIKRIDTNADQVLDRGELKAFDRESPARVLELARSPYLDSYK